MSDEMEFHKPLDEKWWAALMAEEDNLNPDSVPLPKEKLKAEKEAEQDNDWEFVQELISQDQVVECKVTEYNQGGLLVVHEQFQGFVPVSHLVNLKALEEKYKRPEHLRKYLEEELRLKVIECEQDRGRIVLSERAAQAAPGERHRLFNTLEVGDTVEGRVTNITGFGVFVDLGGVEGLAHISELSWGRVDHPKDLFKIGQTLAAQVLKVDQDKGRVSLSVKRLNANPWEDVYERYPQGKSFPVVVTKVVQYGAFVRLEDGLEGLIHITEMSLIDGDTPSDILNDGEQVFVELITADVERQRLSLRLIE